MPGSELPPIGEDISLVSAYEEFTLRQQLVQTAGTPSMSCHPCSVLGDLATVIRR